MNAERPIRVLLVDDHLVLREGLRHLLDRQDAFHVVAEAGDGYEACRIAGEIGPDVVVLDVGLPKLNGIDACRRITRERPDIKVVILTMHDDAPTVDSALKAGARGLVLKGAGAEMLGEAIRAVHAGRAFLDPAVSAFVVDRYLGESEAPPAATLTAREREIVQLLSEGFTSKEAAAQLGLQPKTVQNYRSIIMEKLGVKTTAGLVRYAMQVGITRG